MARPLRDSLQIVGRSPVNRALTSALLLFAAGWPSALPTSTVWASPQLDERNPRRIFRDRANIIVELPIASVDDVDNRGIDIDIDTERDPDDEVLNGGGLAVANQGLVLPPGFFDHYFLGAAGTIDTWRTKMNQILDRALVKAKGGGALSIQERRKLRLAGIGDLKHLENELDDARRRLSMVKDLAKLQKNLQVLQDLRFKALSGPFDQHSLFRKTLVSIRRKQTEAEDKIKEGNGAAEPVKTTKRFDVSAAMAGLRIALISSAAFPQDPKPKATAPKPEKVDPQSILPEPLPPGRQKSAIEQAIGNAGRFLQAPPEKPLEPENAQIRAKEVKRVEEIIIRQRDAEARRVRRNIIFQVEPKLLKLQPGLINLNDNDPSKKLPSDPLAKIDDFDREPAPAVETAVSGLPKGTFETYFLGTATWSDWIERKYRIIDTRIRRIERQMTLSPAEKTKLKLAAVGDVKHLADELEVARRQLENAWDNEKAKLLVLASSEDLRLRASLNPLHENSLFAKMLNAIIKKHAEANTSRPLPSE